jgi:SAM-dependent methyltransferase
VVGIDQSGAMIRMARRRAPRATFARGSIVGARLPSCDGVTAIGEILNYLPGPAAVRRVFRAARRALRPGGAFVFDILLPGRDVRVNARVERDWATISRNVDDGRRLVRTITWFRRVGRMWRRGGEEHVQRLYPEERIAAMLRQEGFEETHRPGPWARHALFVAQRPRG